MKLETPLHSPGATTTSVSLRVMLGCVLLGLVALPTVAWTAVSAHRPLAAYIVVPQARPSPGTHASIQLLTVDARIDILEQVATTTLEIVVTNSSSGRLAAEMVVPVPAGVALHGFDFQGAGAEPAAELLASSEANRLYHEIVAKMRDPALLEFAGLNLIRSRVFPVEGNGWQKVRLTYEQILPLDGDRMDYFLPRSESLSYGVPWQIKVNVRSKTGIATLYSPSHNLVTTRSGPGALRAEIMSNNSPGVGPGPFRLSCLRQRQDVSASLMAYPDPKIGGGYFLLLAAAPLKVPDRKMLRREVILVLDRSGSMAGEKLEQVRAAALQVLEGLEEGEAFNIIVYHEAVESFSPEAVIKNATTMKAARAYLRDLRVRGGTNIHDALVEALRSKPPEGFLPLVLFLTDGLPTVGQTSEGAIRAVATKANPYERRIFTFGVGVDVNTPLLDRLAIDSRAAATFVLPREDVEVKVGQVFKRLAGPVLAAPRLESVGLDHAVRVHELTPSKMPDLFEGDQVVVLGQYRGHEPLHFVLTGNYFGEHRRFEFEFPVDHATTRNAFVPRLWASRKIALLTDAIRDSGADGGIAVGGPTLPNPKVQELVEAIVKLSREFGVLSEYTAFLAREGTDLSRPEQLYSEAGRNFEQRALNTRSGYGSVNQDINNGSQRVLSCVNPMNEFWDANLSRVAISTVQQVNDRAFYRRGQRWIDSQLLGQQMEPHEVVEFGSEEFARLVARLTEQNRPGCASLAGEILLQIDGRTVLIK